MKLNIKTSVFKKSSLSFIAIGFAFLPSVTFANDKISDKVKEPVLLYRDGSTDLGRIYSESLTGAYAQRVGDLKLGASAYVRAWERNKQNKELFDRALHANLVLGNLDAAISQSKQANKELVNEEAKYILAVDALLKGKSKISRELLDDKTIANILPSTREYFARNIVVWSLVKDGKKDAAIALASQTSGIRLLDKNANYSRALIYQYFGDKENAQSFYDTAYQSGARSSIGIDAYLDFLMDNKQKDKALEILSDLRKGDSQPDYYDNLYKRLSADKFTSLKKKKDFNLYTGRGLGVIAQISSADFSNGSALSELKISKKFSPDLYALDVTSAKILYALRMEEDAKTALEGVPFDTSYGEQATRLLAQLEFEKDKPKGLALSEKLLNANPSISNRASSAVYYLDTKNYDKAVDLYSSSIADFDAIKGNAGGMELWQLYFGRANAYLGQEDWTKAIADLRMANDLNPNNPSIMNSLGYTLADRNQDLPEALKLLQRAVSASSRSGETVDSLGWVLFRMGKYDEALDKLELAISLAPGVGEIADHLGDAYYRTNRKTEAQLEWQKAVRLYEKDADKKRVSDKLTNGLPPLAGKTKIADGKK